jgi:xylulokinase
LLGEDNLALRPAKLWNDTEPAPDAARLRELLSPADWAKRTGSVPGPALTVSKLAWTERCYLGLVGRAAHVLLPFDYIVYRLSGNKVTERGGCSGTGYFNPFSNRWDLELASLATPGVDSRKVPAIIESAQAAGKVTQMPFPELNGALVGAGTGDNMAAALGLGIEEGDTVISLGTSGHGLQHHAARTPRRIGCDQRLRGRHRTIYADGDYSQCRESDGLRSTAAWSLRPGI